MKVVCKSCEHKETIDREFFFKVLGGTVAGLGYWGWVSFIFAGTGFAMPIVIAIMAGGGALIAFSKDITEWLVQKYACPNCGKKDWIEEKEYEIIKDNERRLEEQEAKNTRKLKEKEAENEILNRTNAQILEATEKSHLMVLEATEKSHQILLEAKEKKYEEEKERLEQKLDDIRKEKEQLKQDKSLLDNMVLEKQKQLQETSDTDNAFSVLTQEIEFLNSKVQETEEALQSKEKENNALNNEKESLEQQIYEVLEQLEKEKLVLKQKISDLEHKLENKDNMSKEEYDKLSQELEDVKNEEKSAIKKQEHWQKRKFVENRLKIYTNITFKKKSVDEFVSLKDEDSIILEGKLGLLQYDPDKLDIRCKIKGTDFLEIGFASQGRMYVLREGMQFHIYKIGNKNTQDKDIEYLRKLKI